MLCLIKVAHYTLKQFLNSPEKCLIMIDSMLEKTYISQISKTMCNYG